ncbi:hypothetical protein NUW58_g2938 [Xylaria curta]|uniref:Uncharacterized protein n=1 Tax=Xylaria curta TaxID=42375 RepID=A0ACC1PFX0_9PEZI|nr:hypothetical protein NUW58_g2938 [Xylaria curta]
MHLNKAFTAKALDPADELEQRSRVPTGSEHKASTQVLGAGEKEKAVTLRRPTASTEERQRGARQSRTRGPSATSTRRPATAPNCGAALATLRMRQWSDDGYRTVVIASNSKYFVKGASKNVANRDLWEMLFGEAKRYKEEGLAIELWRIKRYMNEITDAAAKKAALKTDDESFNDFMVPGI